MNFGDYNPHRPQLKRRGFSGAACPSVAAIHRLGGGIHRIVRAATGSGLYRGVARTESRVGGAAMVAAMEGRRTARLNTGRILLAIGGAALFLQLWTLWLEAGEVWSRATAQSLGWVGALGMAALQMMDFIAWNPNGILLSLTRVLLLCWPVAVMIAGVAVSRGVN